jgi:hypothetical protein
MKPFVSIDPSNASLSSVITSFGLPIAWYNNIAPPPILAAANFEVDAVPNDDV